MGLACSSVYHMDTTQGQRALPSPAPCCSSSFRSRRGGWKKSRDLESHCDSIEAQVPSSLNLFGEAIILC